MGIVKQRRIVRWLITLPIMGVAWKSLLWATETEPISISISISMVEAFVTTTTTTVHRPTIYRYHHSMDSFRLASKSPIAIEIEIDSATNTGLLLANNNTFVAVQEQNNKNKNNKNNNDDDDIEGRVIASIQSVASTAANIKEHPKEFFSALGTFGSSSGALITKQWLTPESLEECTVFWNDGYKVLMRDLFRSYIFSKQSTRYQLNDWAALGTFLFAASSSSIIFFPLLLPLIKVGLEKANLDIDEGVYVPPSFGSKRLAAMRRLRRPSEASLETYTADYPRNVKEGLDFFRDGTLLLGRDVRRGELTLRNDDDWGTYAWFALLAFSSFPLTPLILPLIDKRRPHQDQTPSDYLPSSYRKERLRVVARLRSLRAIRYGTTPFETLRAAAAAKNSNNNNGNGTNQPPPQLLLEAIVKAQHENRQTSNSPFLEALAGVPGRKWELTYVAGKPAVVAMRKRLGRARNADNNSNNNNYDWVRPLERFWLPWTRLRDGLYIDSDWVSAVQNFDRDTMQNVNGIYSILGSDAFRTTVEGPFSWDGEHQSIIGIGQQRDSSSSNNNNNNNNSDSSKHSSSLSAGICAFRPTKATFRLGPWWEFEQDLSKDTDTPFDETHIRDLPFFKFIHVDDKVAVAMGRSGSVALWKRIEDDEKEQNRLQG